MIQFIVIVEGIIHTGDKILIGRKRLDIPHPLRGKWHFPGGKIKSEEDPYEAIVREIKEETNLSVKPVKIVDAYTYVQSYNLHNKIPQNILHIVFECVPIGNSKIKPADDLIEVKWVRVRNVRKFITKYRTPERPKVKNLLTHLI